MKIKLICNKCNSEVNNLSILYENVLYREDLKKLVDGIFVSDGTEYFQGRIKNIVYQCKNCGEIIDEYDKGEKPYILRPFVNSNLIEVEKNLKIIKE